MILIKCEGADRKSLSEIDGLQGDLKSLSPKNADKLERSIRNNGFIAPFFIWNNKIIDGHQRLYVLKKRFRKEEYPDTGFPVVYIDAENENDAKHKLLQITSSYGEFNTDDLKNWVKNIDSKLDNFTFRNEEIIIDNIPDDDEDKIIKDDVIDEAEKLFNSGDVYKIGNHIVICDNVKEIGKYGNVITATPDVIIIDPPYEKQELYDLIPEYKNGKLVVFWDFKRFAVSSNAAIKKNWTPQYEFIWDNMTSWYTPNRPLARHKACGVFCEDPLFNFDKAIIKDGKKREAKTVKNTRGKSEYKPLDGASHLSTVYQQNKAQMNTGGHSHGKPVVWLEAIFNGIGGEVYLDYFGGSGSTMAVCEKLNKKSITFEIDPKSCDKIVARYKEICIDNNIKQKIEKI